VVGYPIRTPADQFLLADPRSFSQLITSFFASESLGIPHTPFITSLLDLRNQSFKDSRLQKPITQALTYVLALLLLLLFLQYVNELLNPSLLSLTPTSGSMSVDKL
jgi:hypothetical protein